MLRHFDLLAYYYQKVFLKQYMGILNITAKTKMNSLQILRCFSQYIIKTHLNELSMLNTPMKYCKGHIPIFVLFVNS